jgi:hypothetical protein
MVKFTSSAVAAFLFAGISVDAFAPLKGKSHVSSLKMVGHSFSVVAT